MNFKISNIPGNSVYINYEVKFVCNALRENDYQDWLLNKVKKEIKHKKVNTRDRMNEKVYNYVGLPYIKGLSDEMSRILRKLILACILIHIKQLEIFYLK